MGVPPEFDFSPYASPWFAPSSPERERRRALLRRLRVLLLLGLLAFTLCVWVFVRHPDLGGLLPLTPGPSLTVQRHLNAINRGELHEAYDCFSHHYREQVSFEMYHQLIASHWQMFRTREVRLNEREKSLRLAVLETRMLAANGEYYRARFTLVQRDGRWWIDDLRWAAEPDDAGRVLV